MSITALNEIEVDAVSGAAMDGGAGGNGGNGGGATTGNAVGRGIAGNNNNLSSGTQIAIANGGNGGSGGNAGNIILLLRFL